MPTGEVAIEIAAPAEAVFDLLHDYRRRLSWDPFLRRAELLDGATGAGVGVRTLCVARWLSGGMGMGMETVYVSCRRPRLAAVAMTRGPWLLARFAASLRQIPTTERTTRVVYRYGFVTRPAILRPLLDPLAGWLFARETRGRLAALREHLERGGR